MRITVGTVVDGQVILEGAPVPEDTKVTVLAEDEQSESFDVDAEGEAELLAALADIRAGNFVDGHQLLRQISG